MIPKQLQVTDFLPFDGNVTINLDGIQAAVVGGPNGAGKSSFFINAIEFALYGNARGVPNEELIHDGCTRAAVTFVFGHNQKTYAVYREIIKNKGQTLKLFAFDPGKEDDGIDLSDRLLRNTQNTLNDIIGFSQDLLFCTAIAPQDEVNKLSLITPSEREQILSEMLGLGIWEKKKKRVSELINEHGDVLKKYEDTELNIAVLEGNILEHKEKLKQHRLDYAAAENSYSELYNQFQVLQRQFAAREQRVLQKQAIQEQVTILSTEIQTLKLNIEKDNALPNPNTIKERLAVIEQDLEECEQLILSIGNSMPEVQNNIKAWTDKSNEISALRQQQLSVSILDTVPCKGMDIHLTCPLLSMAQGTKRKIDAFIAGQQQAVYTLEDAGIYAAAQTTEWQKKYRSFTENKIQLVNRTANLNNQAHTLNGQIQRSEDVMKWTQLVQNKELLLRQKQSELNSIDVQWDSTQFVTLQDQCTKASTEVQFYKSSIENEEKAIENEHSAINQLQQQLVALLPHKQRMVNYKILLQAYNDIPTLLFTNTIPYVEAYANEFLMRLSADRRIYLRPYKDTKAGTQAKTLDVIGTTSTGARSFKNLSGSEKFRESLALRVALSKVNAELYNTQIGFFIIDEGFGSLDEINVLLIKNALREAAKDFELFIVISHVPELVDTFSKRIIVRPLGKGRRLEVIEHAATAEYALDT